MTKIGNNNILDVLEAGLKAEGLRQKTIASNVANMETPGYRRVDVNFKDLLAQAMDSSGDVDVADLEPEVYRPGNTAVNEMGNDVNLEVEIGAMVKNTLQHKTYIKLLQKKYAQMELAMNVK